MINLDFVGLFLFIAGFIIGLGAVTVIDVLGFLGRKSAYWTEATIRAHKVTKPLIWIGMLLTIIGGRIVYRNETLEGIPLYHVLIACMLLLNGLFLTFYVSPYLLKKERAKKQREFLPDSLQHKLIISLIISDIGWWGGLLLLVQYITR